MGTISFIIYYLLMIVYTCTFARTQFTQKITTIKWHWKYVQSLRAVVTKARVSFSSWLQHVSTSSSDFLT